MQVDFTPEQEAEVLQIATHAGKNAEGWVREVTLRAVKEIVTFRSAVQEGIAQADRGELVDDDHVHQWLENQERA